MTDSDLLVSTLCMARSSLTLGAGLFFILIGLLVVVMKPPKHDSEDVELRFYRPLVRSTAIVLLRRLPASVTLEELMAAGLIGLLSALRKTTERGPQFTSFARTGIKWAMKEECRSALNFVPRRAWMQGVRVCGLDNLGLEHKPDEGLSPLERIELAEANANVEHAFQQLPQREADIIRWHYLEGGQFQEIAERLGVSAPRVFQLKARALGAIREILLAQQ